MPAPVPVLMLCMGLKTSPQPIGSATPHDQRGEDTELNGGAGITFNHEQRNAPEGQS